MKNKEIELTEEEQSKYEELSILLDNLTKTGFESELVQSLLDDLIESVWWTRNSLLKYRGYSDIARYLFEKLMSIIEDVAESREQDRYLKDLLEYFYKKTII